MHSNPKRSGLTKCGRATEFGDIDADFVSARHHAARRSLPIAMHPKALVRTHGPLAVRARFGFTWVGFRQSPTHQGLPNLLAAHASQAAQPRMQ